jgi:hypothetical protein
MMAGPSTSGMKRSASQGPGADCLKAGILVKQPFRGSFGRSKTRFFALTRDHLSYYADESAYRLGAAPLGQLSIGKRSPLPPRVPLSNHRSRSWLHQV